MRETGAERPPTSKARVRFWLLVTATVCALVAGAINVLAPYLTGDGSPIPAGRPVAVPTFDGDPFVSARNPIGPLDPSGDSLAHRPSDLGLIGAVYTDYTLRTQSMGLPGVPFTFIVPETWGCEESVVTPSHTVQRCADRIVERGAPQLELEVDRCPSGCSDADRAAVEKSLRHQVERFFPDPYATLGTETVAGRYYLTAVDVFTVNPEEPLQWVVVAQADSIPADAAIVQRIVNDIYGQTRV
jgi:hypothetical protein